MWPTPEVASGKGMKSVGYATQKWKIRKYCPQEEKRFVFKSNGLIIFRWRGGGGGGQSEPEMEQARWSRKQRCCVTYQGTKGWNVVMSGYSGHGTKIPLSVTENLLENRLQINKQNVMKRCTNCSAWKCSVAGDGNKMLWVFSYTLPFILLSHIVIFLVIHLSNGYCKPEQNICFRSHLSIIVACVFV